MSGVVAVRSVLIADGTLTALVPATRIIGDDVLPQGVTLPAILLKEISGVDRNIPAVGSLIHTRERVQIEIHAATNASRKAVKEAARSAIHKNPLPTVSGLTNVTLHTEGKGPDFYNEDPFVRVGVQDVLTTYSKGI